MSGRINSEIEECIRNNVTWQALPRHLQQVRVHAENVTKKK